MSQAATTDRFTEEMQKPSGISPRVVVNAVWRHPVAFTLVVLFALLAGAGIWFFLPLPKKTAGVVFHVSSQGHSLFSSGPGNAADFASYKQSQIALIKSRRTLSAVLNNDEVKSLNIIRTAEPDDMTWLDKHVVVDSKTGSEQIRVTIEGDDDQELLILVKALQDEYLALSKHRDKGDLEQRFNMLKKSYEEIDSEVKRVQGSISKLRQIGGPEGIYQFLNDQYHQQEYQKAFDAHEILNDRFRSCTDDLKAAKKYFATLKAASGGTAILAGAGSLFSVVQGEGTSLRSVPQAAIEAALLSDSGIRELEDAVTRARDVLFKTEELAPGGMSAAHVKAREALKLAEESRDKYRLEKRPLIEARLKEGALASAEHHLEKTQSEYLRIEAEKNRASQKVLEKKQWLKNLGDSKLELARLQAVIEHKEPLAAKMASEIEKLRLGLGTQSRVTVQDDPFVVQGIEGSRRLKYALLAALGALVLGFGGLVMVEHRGRRVTRTEEVSTDLGTRLIGTIPPIVPSTDVATSHEINSPLVEAIDTTRIMLTHAGVNGSKLRVLMVTSAVSGEGKTTLSGNLAISLTRAGFRTLLIDGDMQAPSAHVLFDIPDAPGLSELLRGETDLGRAVRPSPIPGLSILPAGCWNISTRQSLVGDRWRTLKQQLESEFDFVVIDTSPLLMVSDAMLLAREADGVVLSVLLGVSQIARVAETVNRLQAIGAKLAGVVVNNVQSEVYRRYMSRSKYAAPAPVAPDQDETAFADEDEAGPQVALAEEIGAGTVTQTKEGSR